MTPDSRLKHKTRNIVHSLVLIVGLALLMSLCAWILWGLVGVLWGLSGALLACIVGPRVSPKMTMRLFRARELSPHEAGHLGEILRVLSARAELPAVPRLNLIPSQTLNAFAVGRPGDAAIALSTGLLERLTLREATGVLAHEVSHVANNDLWIMAIADTFGRLTQVLSWIGVFLFLLNLPLLLTGAAGVPWAAIALLYFAPSIGNLLQLALSRAREYDADLDGADLSGDPAGLASALQKLERYQGRMWEDMIPTGRRIPHPSVLRTHPPTEERVRRLMTYAAGRTAHPPLLVEEAPRPQGLAPLHARPRFFWPGVWF